MIYEQYLIVLHSRVVLDLETVFFKCSSDEKGYYPYRSLPLTGAAIINRLRSLWESPETIPHSFLSQETKLILQFCDVSALLREIVVAANCIFLNQMWLEYLSWWLTCRMKLCRAK